jgi:hypothetical protein
MSFIPSLVSIGVSISNMRVKTLNTFPSTTGCTKLNEKDEIAAAV